MRGLRWNMTEAEDSRGFSVRARGQSGIAVAKSCSSLHRPMAERPTGSKPGVKERDGELAGGITGRGSLGWSSQHHGAICTAMLLFARDDN